MKLTDSISWPLLGWAVSPKVRLKIILPKQLQLLRQQSSRMHVAPSIQCIDQVLTGVSTKTSIRLCCTIKMILKCVQFGWIIVISRKRWCFYKKFFISFLLLKTTILVHFIAERRPTSVQLILYTFSFFRRKWSCGYPITGRSLNHAVTPIAKPVPSLSLQLQMSKSTHTHTQATLGKLEHLRCKKDCNCVEMESVGSVEK